MRTTWLVGLLAGFLAAWSCPGGEDGSAEGGKASFREEVRNAWGFPGEEIASLRSRIWFSEGRSTWATRHAPNDPANFWGKTSWEYDDTENTFVLLEGDLRVPHLRWLHVMGEINLFTTEMYRGVFSGDERDLQDDGARWDPGGRPYTDPINAWNGASKILDMDYWQLNLGVRVLGQDAFWSKRPSRSSVTMYFGCRGYTEDHKLTKAEQYITNSAPTDTWLGEGGTYRFDYDLWQIGLKAQCGFGDMLKGLSGLVDFAGLFGEYHGTGYWAPTDLAWKDRAPGEGWLLRIGLEYQREWFSASFGYQWLWLEARDGSRNDGSYALREVDNNRMGITLGFGLHF